MILPLSRIELIGAFLAAAGTIGLFLPSVPLSLPKFSSANADQLSEEQQTLPVTSVTASRFDLSGLSRPVKVEPKQTPVDPAAELRKWRLTGVILNDQNAIALLEGPGGSLTLRTGDQLAGFVAEKIEARVIKFSQGEANVSLSLPQPTDG